MPLHASVRILSPQIAARAHARSHAQMGPSIDTVVADIAHGAATAVGAQRIARACIDDGGCTPGNAALARLGTLGKYAGNTESTLSCSLGTLRTSRALASHGFMRMPGTMQTTSLPSRQMRHLPLLGCPIGSFTPKRTRYKSSRRPATGTRYLAERRQPVDEDGTRRHTNGAD